MNEKDFADAIYHLEALPLPRQCLHRVELQRLLLLGLTTCLAAERTSTHANVAVRCGAHFTRKRSVSRMPKNRRLVWNRTEKVDSLGGPLATYSVELEQGGTLAVSIPRNPTPNQTIEVADQLRELVDVLSMGATETDSESAARSRLLARAKGLQERHTQATGKALERLLEDYGAFRGDVVEHLLSIAYLCSTARKQVFRLRPCP
jgi:hypothetical protein